MARRRRRAAMGAWLRAGTAAALVLAAGGAAAAAPAELCRDAARQASERTGVPFDVLMAITLTETGRGGAGGAAPWPWALNLGGQSVWAENRAAALAVARRARAEGRSNFDVGCFQLNYRWHGANFASLEEMIDPGRNALHAARFLAELHGQTGDWISAAGRYHSATEVHAARYRARFETHLAALSGGPLPAGPLPAAAPARENRFPLLTGGGAPRVPGSLVPGGQGGPSLLTRARGPFWSGS